MGYPTFREKKEKEGLRGFCDRQNTKWSHEIKDKCNHEWSPVSMALIEGTQPDLTNARTYCICMKCCSHTYIETAWVGYYIGSPDLLEEPEE
jgi:hypothetical protein